MGLRREAERMLGAETETGARGSMGARKVHGR